MGTLSAESLTARERLALWITRSTLNQLEASRVIGIDPTQLNHILKGKRSPGLLNAVKIERATGITVDGWVSSELGESAA